MTEQVTALIKFQTCDLTRELATATAAYDSAEATAWVVPFTQAQQAYWAEQAYWNSGIWTEPFNGYAADYATQRTDAITNTANSAYQNCLLGGATSPSLSAAEAKFQVVVQSQLSGNVAAGSNTTQATGPTTQLSIAFAPAQAPSPLDWRAFYRLGAVHINFNFIENWLMSFPAGGGYTQQVYTTLPMRPSIQVEASNLVSIAADFIPYIDVPDGQFIEVPADVAANFTAIQSSFSFTVYRWVYLPDGQVIEMHVDWSDQMTGALSDQRATVEFPELGATCDESGTVDVYHFITAYAIGTLYKLADQVQRVRTQYGVYDFEVPADMFGSTPPGYGPPGYLSLHESFQYQAAPAHSLLGIGIVRVKYYQDSTFKHERTFLVWDGSHVDPARISKHSFQTNPATSNFIGVKSTTQTSYASIPVDIWSLWSDEIPDCIQGTFPLPVVEDVTVNYSDSEGLSVSASSHVSLSNDAIVISGMLKAAPNYTPLGPFVTNTPGYSATGPTASVVPDFIEGISFRNLGSIWLSRVNIDGSTAANYRYLVWKAEPINSATLACLNAGPLNESVGADDFDISSNTAAFTLGHRRELDAWGLDAVEVIERTVIHKRTRKAFPGYYYELVGESDFVSVSGDFGRTWTISNTLKQFGPALATAPDVIWNN